MLTLTAVQIPWACLEEEVLHKYRMAHRLETAPSFHSTLNAAVLTAPGIARRSPTMMSRRKNHKPKVPKEQLALAVRKHFNSMAVNEGEVLVDFIYSVKNKGMLSRKRLS